MTETVKAIESPKHLYGWFTAKGYKHLVYRMSDVQQLPDNELAVLDLIVSRLNIGGADAFRDRTPGDRLRASCPTGYLLIPIDRLYSQPWADMALMIDLQRATMIYREIRRQMGYFEKVEACKCKGLDNKCRQCGGKGYTRTILEMSPEEVRLVHGS